MGATKLNFSHQAILTSIFKVLYDLVIKSKVVDLNDEILEIPSGLNPIGAIWPYFSLQVIWTSIFKA